MNHLQDQQQTSKHYLPWIMWGLGALFYCYEFLLQVTPSVMVPDLMKAFSANSAQLGLALSLYFYAYSSVQIPVGILLDRLGPRRLLTLATLVCGSGALLFSAAHILTIAAVGRLLIGLGSAFAVVGCMHLCAIWLPLRYFATLTGVMVTMGMLGAIGGQAPVSFMVAHFGWRETLFIFGIVGLLLSIAMWAFVRDNKSYHQKENHSERKISLFAGLKQILKNKQNLVVATYGALMFAPTTTFGGLWGVPFLTTFYHIDRHLAATLVSMLFIGWVFGSPLFGIISDRLHRRKIPMIIGSYGALITLSIVLFIPHLPLFLLGALLCAFGFFSSGFLPSFSIIREINPHRLNATSIGFMNTFNMLTGAIMQPLVGVILDLTWHGMLNNGVRVYSAASFQTGLILLPIGILVSLITLPFIRETYCQPIDTLTDPLEASFSNKSPSAA
jgi:MFS family permease